MKLLIHPEIKILTQWQFMTWIIGSPRHLELYHWLCGMSRSFPSPTKDFNYLHCLSDIKWWKMEVSYKSNPVRPGVQIWWDQIGALHLRANSLSKMELYISCSLNYIQYVPWELSTTHPLPWTSTSDQPEALSDPVASRNQYWVDQGNHCCCHSIWQRRMMNE